MGKRVRLGVGGTQTWWECPKPDAEVPEPYHPLGSWAGEEGKGARGPESGPSHTEGSQCVKHPTTLGVQQSLAHATLALSGDSVA